MLDQRKHYSLIGLQGFDGGCLVLAHEAAVTDNIGTEYRSEFSLEGICGHGITPLGILKVKDKDNGG
ncbi:MAG: hypothetical protein JW896_09235 [Deltaproteobacteria bacterium]|nr:hypothetical protein [Deltaproteobacteria bacterium]